MHQQPNDALLVGGDGPQILCRRMHAIIQAGRVLRRQDNRLLGHPRGGGRIVRLKHRVHVYLGVIKKPIRCFGLGPIPIAALRHIALGTSIKVPGQHEQPFAQPLISQLGLAKFFFGPVLRLSLGPGPSLEPGQSELVGQAPQGFLPGQGLH